MARDEHQPQQVVVDVVVQRVLVAAAAFVLDVLQFPREFFVLAFEQLQAAQAVGFALAEADGLPAAVAEARRLLGGEGA